MKGELIHSYQPFGTAVELFYSRDPEVLYCGPAGTGKSRACLEKIHLLAMKYPNARILMVRKTLVSLTGSGIQTYEEHVAKEHLISGEVVFFGGSTREPASYRYKNGSRIVLGGMDKALKVMSTEYDIIYAQEATELTEKDWDSLTTRLRNGRIPYQQLIADCNPDMPTHWLKVRCDRGRTKMINSRHMDNPVYFDQGTKEPTPKGREYVLGKLGTLEGVMRERYYKGIWAAAEGLVYEDYNPSTHIYEKAKEPPKDWTRYLSIDFGFTNPFVCQFWAIDHDGRMYLYKEIYRTRGLVEDHAKLIKDLLRNEPRPQYILTDHDAEDRATLEKHLGMSTTKANKNVSEGIQAVASRMKVQPDGKPRIYLCRDAVVSRDSLLENEKKPCSTLEEIAGYVWNTDKDAPVKLNDHGMDAMRYMVAHLDIRDVPTLRTFNF